MILQDFDASITFLGNFVEFELKFILKYRFLYETGILQTHEKQWSLNV